MSKQAGTPDDEQAFINASNVLSKQQYSTENVLDAQDPTKSSEIQPPPVIPDSEFSLGYTNENIGLEKDYGEDVFGYLAFMN